MASPVTAHQGLPPCVPDAAETGQGKGLWLGMVIFAAWLTSLLVALASDPVSWPLPLIVLAVALRTFLQTGLFILGHDAMHRSLVPGNRALNDALGRLALLFYAGLPYGLCRRHHLRHHQLPGSPRDPDARPPGGKGVLGWYAGFMASYLSTGQLALLLSVWLAVAAIPSAGDARLPFNVLLFWILPLVLSSGQLFLFGTYLPHRSHGDPVLDPQRALAQVHSLRYGRLWSLLACYHFGYHREHHAFPSVPWFDLPDLGRPPVRSGACRRARSTDPAFRPPAAQGARACVARSVKVIPQV